MTSITQVRTFVLKHLCKSCITNRVVFGSSLLYWQSNCQQRKIHYMRDVVVIGGGLSGLSACYELEKRNIRYTVIEVKPRFGGSIISSRELGFVLDGGAFAIQPFREVTILKELELVESMYPMDNGAKGFNEGTESLITALANKLTKGRLMRMAVSSIGWLDGRFTICLENGIMYDAGSVIVASPARYAERMFYTLAPDVSTRLRDYHYDTIFRVSLGYHKDDVPDELEDIPDMCFPFAFKTDHLSRVSDSDHVLVHVGVRAQPDTEPDNVIREVIQGYGLGDNPLVKRVHYWSEADPLSCYDDDHADNMQAIREALPDGIYLVGSDYSDVPPQHKGVANLNDRIIQGRAAGISAYEDLKARKNAKS